MDTKVERNLAAGEQDFEEVLRLLKKACEQNPTARMVTSSLIAKTGPVEVRLRSSAEITRSS